MNEWRERARAPWQVSQGDTERLPPNFKKRLHDALDKLVTEKTLVKEGKYLYHLPPPMEGGLKRGDEPMSPPAEVRQCTTELGQNVNAPSSTASRLAHRKLGRGSWEDKLALC